MPVAIKVFILKKKTPHANGADHMHAGSGFYSCSHFTMLRPAVLSSETKRHRLRSSEAAPPVCIACMHASLHSCKTSRRRLGRRARRAQQASGHPPRMHGGWLGAGAGHAPRARSRDVRITHACAAAVRTWGFPHAWLTTKRATGKPVTRGVH